MSSAALKTGYKVKLVPFSPEFGEKIFEWYYDVNYQSFFRECNLVLTLDHCKNFDKLLSSSCVGTFMIVEKKSAKPVGIISCFCLRQMAKVVRADIMLEKKHQHKTYAIDALNIIGDYLFNRLRYNKLVIEYLASDQHIRRISEKGGFTFEGIQVQEAFMNGQLVDVEKCYMLKKTYDECFSNYFDCVKDE